MGLKADDERGHRPGGAAAAGPGDRQHASSSGEG